MFVQLHIQAHNCLSKAFEASKDQPIQEQLQITPEYLNPMGYTRYNRKENQQNRIDDVKYIYTQQAKLL